VDELADRLLMRDGHWLVEPGEPTGPTPATDDDPVETADKRTPQEMEKR